MTFVDYMKKGIEAVQLKRDAIQLLADDKQGLGPALGILAIGGVCLAIGSLSLIGIIMFPIGRIIGVFIVVAIMHFVATSFMGGQKATMISLLVPISCASIISWIGIIPFAGPVLAFLAGLWLLVVTVLSVEYVYHIDRTKAIIVVAVPVVLCIIISFIVFVIVGLSAWALFAR